MSQKKSEQKESFSELKNKFNVAGDYNLALSLQEAEFSQHYESNRSARRISLEDHRVSSEEQTKERQNARNAHLSEMNKVIQDDELLALELQRQFEEEERQYRESLVNSDAELAQKLAAELNQNSMSSNYPLPSSSTDQSVNELESLFEPNANSHTNGNAVLTNWSSTNPFLQDLFDAPNGNLPNSREQSTEDK